MLDHFVLFIKRYGRYGKKEVIYRREYMLYFLLFMVVSSAGYYVSMLYHLVLFSNILCLCRKK